METPIYSRLLAYHRKNRISFAMPGHKNLRGLSPDLQLCDVTELSETVDLHHECDTMNDANRRLSELYRTRQSFIMTCGSTAGVQAMLASVLHPGELLLASADCHISVVNTCALCGFRLKLIPIDQELNITREVRAVLLTSPNYYGKVKDIESAAKICRKWDIPLLVDEAHGAHFIASDKFPQSAVRYADMVCHSAHKTLNALTGAAYLHVCGESIDTNRVKRALCSFQTSSPSYPIAASADAARATLEQTCYDNIIDECKAFCEAIERATNIKAMKTDDITRLVLSFADYDLNGFDVENELSSHFGIDVEMADFENIVLIVTPWNTHNDFMSLFNALRDITDMANVITKRTVFELPPVTEEIVSPSEGWFADTEYVKLSSAEGKVSASAVAAYPPGVAFILPGSRINKAQLDYISELRTVGAKVTGLNDDKIEVVK